MLLPSGTVRFHRTQPEERALVFLISEGHDRRCAILDPSKKGSLRIPISDEIYENDAIALRLPRW